MKKDLKKAKREYLVNLLMEPVRDRLYNLMDTLEDLTEEQIRGVEKHTVMDFNIDLSPVYLRLLHLCLQGVEEKASEPVEPEAPVKEKDELLKEIFTMQEEVLKLREAARQNWYPDYTKLKKEFDEVKAERDKYRDGYKGEINHACELQRELDKRGY